MKIPIKLWMIAGASILSSAAFAQDKFDATSNLIMDTYERFVSNPSLNIDILKEMPIQISEGSSRADIKTSIIISLQPGYTAEDVEALGMEVLSELGGIVVASGTFEQIKEAAKCDFSKSLSFGNRLRPMMNQARSVTGAQSVQNGTGLPQGYDGTGVIAGIMDTGVDPNHLNFLDSKGNSRFDRLWWFNSDGGSFTEYTNDNISTFECDVKYESHGTHTLGCMSGSWNGKGNGGVATSTGTRAQWTMTAANPYYGMAPGSTIACGAGELYPPNYIVAVSNIVKYANSVKKPFVINLSLGSNSGAHDGSDESGQALAAAADAGGIIFVSGGNEGEDNISIVKDFTSSSTSVSTFMNCTGGVSGNISFWSADSKDFTVTIFVYNRSTNKIEYSYDFTPNGESSSYNLGYLGMSVDSFSSGFSSASYLRLSRSTNSGTNNRYSVSGYYRFTYNNLTNSGGKNYAIGFKVTGKAGQHIDITSSNSSNSIATFTDYGVSGYTNGTPDFSINDLACNPKVISVGAWTARTSWPAYSPTSTGNAGMFGFTGEGYRINNVAGFSSYGTLVDGRKLPEICAPGVGVVSSISRFYFNNEFKGDLTGISAAQKTPNSYKINPGVENYWYSMTGTSMASPVAAGGVALWLQANPYLNYNDVKKIIKESAKTTGLPAANPEARWGGGRLEVLAGMKLVLNSGGINDVTVDSDNLLFTPVGQNEWDIFVAGAKNVSVEVYSLSGVKVSSLSSKGENLNFNGNDLDKGVYVMTINGTDTKRIAIK